MQSPQQETNVDDHPADKSHQSPTGDHGQNGLDDVIEDVKSSGKEKVERYRGAAAGKVDSLTESARAAASGLDDEGLEGQLSHQLDNLAKGMGTLSSALRDKSADEILRDVRRIAREHPALFLTGSVALGIAASRFVGASSKTPGTGRSADEGKDTVKGDKDLSKAAPSTSTSNTNENIKTDGASGTGGTYTTSAISTHPVGSTDVHAGSGPGNTEKHS